MGMEDGWGDTVDAFAAVKAYTVSITINIKQFSTQTQLTHTHPVIDTKAH